MSPSEYVKELKADKILPSAVLSQVNSSEIIEKWDNDNVMNDFFEAALTMASPYSNDDECNARELTFRKVFDHTNNDDLSAYICDEIDLIFRCLKKGFVNEWVNNRSHLYFNGQIPYHLA